MTRDGIIRMAREAHLDVLALGKDFETYVGIATRFANLVADAERKECYDLIDTLVKAEREMCARVCDEFACEDDQGIALDLASAIRARGE